MSAEEGTAGQERWRPRAEYVSYIRKAQAEFDGAKESPIYKQLVRFRTSHAMAPESETPDGISVIFTDIAIEIPYKFPQVRDKRVFGVRLPLPPETRIRRKIEELYILDRIYETQEDKDGTFLDALPDLRELITFGNRTEANYWEFKRRNVDIGETGGIGLSQEDRKKYEAVDFSQYNLENLTFIPIGTAFRLVWGNGGLRGEPFKIDTRYVWLDLPNGKTRSPQTPDEWQVALGVRWRALEEEASRRQEGLRRFKGEP